MNPPTGSVPPPSDSLQQSATPIAESQNAPSIISSRMTDIASEDGGTSRPVSALSSQPTGSQPPPSRRGPPPLSSLLARSSLAAGSSRGPSRPQSSASRISRTHVPSLTSHAFFRPMSSQRLQAQRGGRPNTTQGQSLASEDGHSDVASQARRSVGSNPTIRLGPFMPPDNDDPPPSRGTEFTDPAIPDRATSNASPTGNATLRSLGESVKLLQNRSLHPGPTHLDLGKNYKSGAAKDPPQKSPRSFRSGFRRSNKNEGQPHVEGQGHERLSSAPSSPRSAAPKVPTPPPRSSLGKNYEYFSGNTVFCWGGRLQNSRDRPINIATGVVLVVPAVLFFVYSAPWLWHNVSPAIPILFGYIFFICLSSFVHASLVDPGIFPRNLHLFPPPDENDDPLTLGPPTNDWVMVRLATTENAAMDIPVKYCKTCNIWRPPRTYHCRVCDNCVETLDHHCVWLNNCVGRRNYRYFFTFVSSATLLGLFLVGACLAQCLVYRSQLGMTFREAINEYRVPFAMVIYGVLATPYPASLWVYHLFLMGRGETTREYLNSHKFLKQDRHHPFTQGNFFKNWMVVMARPRPPTYLHFKKRYEEGDQRFGPRRCKTQAPLVEEAQGGGMEMHKVKGAVPSFQGPRSKSTRPAQSAV